MYDVAALVCTLFTQSMPAPAFVTRSLQPLLSLTTKIQFAKFIISHFEMMKGKKSMYVFLAFPSQNDSIAGHCLFRGFHVLVERLQQRGTGKHWGGWVIPNWPFGCGKLGT